MDDNYISVQSGSSRARGHGRAAPVPESRLGDLLGIEGLVTDEASAAALDLEDAEGCFGAARPTPDADGIPIKDDLQGRPQHRRHPSHVTNWAFGGGGIFHGALPPARSRARLRIARSATGRWDARILRLRLRHDRFRRERPRWGPLSIWPGSSQRTTTRRQGGPTSRSGRRGRSVDAPDQYYKWPSGRLAGDPARHDELSDPPSHRRLGYPAHALLPRRYGGRGSIIEETHAMERYIDAQAAVREGLLPYRRLARGGARGHRGWEDGHRPRHRDLGPVRPQARPRTTPVCDESYVIAQPTSITSRGPRAVPGA